MKRFICLCILGIFLVFMYSKYIETASFTTYEYTISNPKIPQSFNGYKIAHFSDLLYNNEFNKDLLNTVAGTISNSNSDIIIFTGDLTKGKLKENHKKELIEVLKNMDCNFYKYAILGDKDTKTNKEILEAANFIILEENSILLFNNGNIPIYISDGIKIENEEENQYYKIALIHEPDKYDDIKNDYNLVLAGHSLGGLMRIPYVGATIKKNGALKYTDRIYHEKESDLYITFGIGTRSPNIRLFNKPSINIYRLYN